jgi:hypothetical protein
LAQHSKTKYQNKFYFSHERSPPYMIDVLWKKNTSSWRSLACACPPFSNMGPLTITLQQSYTLLSSTLLSYTFISDIRLPLPPEAFEGSH